MDRFCDVLLQMQTLPAKCPSVAKLCVLSLVVLWGPEHIRPTMRFGAKPALPRSLKVADGILRITHFPHGS